MSISWSWFCLQPDFVLLWKGLAHRDQWHRLFNIQHSVIDEPCHKQEDQASVENETSQGKAPQPLRTNKGDKSGKQANNAESKPDKKPPKEPFKVGGEHTYYHATSEPHERRSERDCIPHGCCSIMRSLWLLLAMIRHGRPLRMQIRHINGHSIVAAREVTTSPWDRIGGVCRCCSLATETTYVCVKTLVSEP